MPNRSGSRSPRSPRGPKSPPGAGADPVSVSHDDGVQRSLKINVPSKTPTDLASALRELERVRTAQEKSAAAALAATRRAFDEQTALEKKLERVEGELAKARVDVEEAKALMERESQEAKKSVKAAKKKVSKLETRLEEQIAINAKWEERANQQSGNLRGELTQSAEALERASKREIELEDKCARQESALVAAKAQAEELRTTLESEREKSAAKLSASENEASHLRQQLEEALEMASTAKEEADMTVESMRAALDAQVNGQPDPNAEEEIRVLRERIEELSKPQSTSTEDAAKISRLEERIIALERILEGERKAKSTAAASVKELAEETKKLQAALDAERAAHNQTSSSIVLERAENEKTKESQIHQLEADLKDVTAKMAELQTVLDDERKASANAKAKAANEIQAIRNTSKTAEKAIATATSAMDAAESRALQAEKSASDFEVTIKALREEIQTLQAREKELGEQLNEASANDSDQFNAKQAIIDELKSKIEALETTSAQVSELKTALVAATDAATTAAQSIEESEAELSKSHQKIALIEKDLSEVREQAASSAKEVETRDAQIRDLTRDLQSMKKRMKDAETKFNEMTLSASSTSATDEEDRKQRALELQTATSLADAAESRAAGLESQLKLADEARNEAVANERRLTQELDKAHQALAEAEALKALSDKAQAENDRLNKELGQSREASEELKCAQSDIQRLTKELTAAQNSLKASKAAASRAVQEAVSASSKRAQDLTKELDQVRKQLAEGKSQLESHVDETKQAKMRAAELEILVDQLRESLETAELDASTRTNDKLDMEYMRREEDLRAEISDLVLELQAVKDDALEKVEAAERRVATLEVQLEELEAALSQSRDTVRVLSVENSAKESGSAQEMSELRRKLVEAQEIAATASGNTEAVKRRYEARLRDASELAEKQIISLSKELESAKRTVDLAEKAKEHAKADVKRVEDAFELKAKAYEQQIESVRKEVTTANEEKLALLDKIDEAHVMHEEIRKQRDAMEVDLVETCSILEKVSEKASTSADEYKKALAQVNAGAATLKETLEAEILLTMERVEEKELIVKDMEVREAERTAQIELLQEKLSTNTAELKAYELKLKDATAGERERLIVLQKENSRLEKRLTDTWAALQGAHAVVEQTKAAAKKAVGAANHAAAKAEKVALQAKQELEEIRNSHRRDAENAARLQAQVDDLMGRDDASRAEIARIKAEKESEIARLKRNSAPAAPHRPRTSGALDEEMMRASDLLERLGRSRESSMRDETESQDRISNADVASFQSFGYGGASALD